jgi:hypothetical protein
LETICRGELEEFLAIIWFQIRGIPSNYRNNKVIPYVGSLIGVTREVDEENIDKYDFVRASVMLFGCGKGTSCGTRSHGEMYV